MREKNREEKNNYKIYLWRHDMHEAGAEKNEEDGERGPGQELQAHVGNQVLHQPQPRLYQARARWRSANNIGIFIVKFFSDGHF